jgi:hypothetical protein
MAIETMKREYKFFMTVSRHILHPVGYVLAVECLQLRMLVAILKWSHSTTGMAGVSWGADYLGRITEELDECSRAFRSYAAPQRYPP